MWSGIIPIKEPSVSKCEQMVKAIQGEECMRYIIEWRGLKAC